MRITFSIPPKQLKQHRAELATRLTEAIPGIVVSFDLKKGYLALDLDPQADPIRATELLRSITAPWGITPARVPNDVYRADSSVIRMFDEKPARTVKMSRYVISLIAVALICSVLAFSVAVMFFGGTSALFEDTLGTGEQEGEAYAEKIGIIDFLFENYGLYDTDGNLLLDEMLRAYVDATGDKYAAYYTDEELKEMMSDMEGSAVGIGVTVTLDSDENGDAVISVIRVAGGSPAETAGVLPGDKIVAVGTPEANESVKDIGYEAALEKLLGEEGTEAKFVVKRDGEEIAFSIVRAKFIVVSVQGRQSATDPTVGIVSISGFEANTPIQFKNEMAKLLQAGCTRFVYDVRNNPGGELKSIRTVLSYFANEGDVLVSTVTKQGETTYYKAEAISYTGEYAACSVTKEEIGIYRQYPATVLANGRTASAAELFTAALRDFGLAEVVGENTRGKGVLQTIFDLSAIGNRLNMDISGGLKLTVGYYTPPCGVNYDGKGIAPDVAVTLSEEAQEKNFYMLDEAEDAQLLAAITQVKSK